MRSLTEKIIGWIGFSLLLGAFALAGFSILSTQNLVYLCMNFLGSLIMGFVSWKNKVYPALIVDVFWLGITLFGFAKILF